MDIDIERGYLIESPPAFIPWGRGCMIKSGYHTVRRASMLVSLIVFLAIALMPLAQLRAACGRDKIPTYDDITEVGYSRGGSLGPFPIYKVIFSSTDLYYLGEAYTIRLGSYDAQNGGPKLIRAIAVLKKSHFFDLSVYQSSTAPLGGPFWSVAAERCGVTTTLEWKEENRVRSDLTRVEVRPDIKALFEGLNAITNEVKWHRSSNVDPSVWWMLP